MSRWFRTNTAKSLTLAVLVAGLTGCSTTGAPVATAPSSPVPPAAASSAAPERTAAASPSAAGDSVEALPAALRTRMTGVSWRPGCPVGLADLRLVHVAYVGFDGALHPGELVVHQAIADRALRVFQRLRAQHFPIRSMQTIEVYGGSDDDSMAADNTSGFNCRNVPGTSHWSNHAYGRAVDVNTVENPYLPPGRVMPPAGHSYLDRHDGRPGMITAGDATVRAFAAEGFTWGGAWPSGPDYQHFERAA